MPLSHSIIQQTNLLFICMYKILVIPSRCPTVFTVSSHSPHKNIVKLAINSIHSLWHYLYLPNMLRYFHRHLRELANYGFTALLMNLSTQELFTFSRDSRQQANKSALLVPNLKTLKKTTQNTYKNQAKTDATMGAYDIFPTPFTTAYLGVCSSCWGGKVLHAHINKTWTHIYMIQVYPDTQHLLEWTPKNR